MRPDGFEISQAGNDTYGSTTERAASEGQPLATALSMLCPDIVAVDLLDGRLCFHHLELDAGVIVLELRRAALGDLEDSFVRIATHGFFTMNPDMTQ